MTPGAVLIDLLERVGAGPDDGILITRDELSVFPKEAVTALTAQKLIVKAKPANSAICPGCERECIMPVHVTPDQSGDAASFVVCDKRSDINRVNISADQLIQWRCNAKNIAEFIANGLSLRSRLKSANEPRMLEIGMATGNKRSQMLCLNFNNVVTILAGSQGMVLADIVMYSGGRYQLDEERIRRLVDSSTSGDPQYTPSTVQREARKLDTQAMYASWAGELKRLRKRRPNMSDVWYSKQIAKMDISQGRDAETIRKKMKN